MDLLLSGEVWALAAGLLWAVAVILFKVAGESVPPVALNVFKSVIASASFVPLLLLIPREVWTEWTPADWARIAASGVLGIAVADTLFFMALNRLGAGLNAIVNCSYFPVMVVVAYVALAEPASAAALGGGALVVFGILVGSVGPPPADRSRADILAGVVIGLGGMGFLGLGVALIDPLLTDTPAVLAVTTFRLLMATAALLPAVVLARYRSVLLGLARPSAWWRTAVPASFLGSSLAMFAWLYGFARADMALAAILNQLSTIWIFVLAAAFLGEPLSRRRVMALLLAFAGAVLAVGAASG